MPASTVTKLEEAKAGLAQCEMDTKELQGNYRINQHTKMVFMTAQRKFLKAWQDVVQKLGGEAPKKEDEGTSDGNDDGSGKELTHV